MLRHDFPPLLSVGQSSAPAPLELQLVSKRRLANRRHAPSVLRGRESICSTTESIFSDPSRRSHTASTIGISTPAVCAASRSTGAVNAPSATVLRSAISTAALSPLPRPKPRLKLREDCEEQVSTSSPRPDRRSDERRVGKEGGRTV